jgi:hypothetical protein
MAGIYHDMAHRDEDDPLDINVDYLHNILTVEGDPGSVARAKAMLSTGPAGAPIEFQLIVPLPDARVDYMTACRRAWGTYEDPLAVRIVGDEPGCLRITFQTAGGAPESVMRELSRKIPGADVRLDSVWSSDPHKVSASGTWRNGEGELREVEASREHFAKVMPDTADWQLDELFPIARPAGP